MILITDLFPGNYYENLRDFDAFRTREMDPEESGLYMMRAKKMLAFDRALDFLRLEGD